MLERLNRIDLLKEEYEVTLGLIIRLQTENEVDMLSGVLGGTWEVAYDCP